MHHAAPVLSPAIYLAGWLARSCVHAHNSGFTLGMTFIPSVVQRPVVVVKRLHGDITSTSNKRINSRGGSVGAISPMCGLTEGMLNTRAMPTHPNSTACPSLPSSLLFLPCPQHQDHRRDRLPLPTLPHLGQVLGHHSSGRKTRRHLYPPLPRPPSPMAGRPPHSSGRTIRRSLRLCQTERPHPSRS